MTNTLTPLMRQYYQIKSQYPDTLILFQVGDFYEIFFQDAINAANLLGIALTQRGTDQNGNPIPLCGVPIHVLDHYLTKLVKGGYKVAICDQLEAPTPGKIVERGITQVLTPGTLTDLKLLDSKSSSYLCTFFPVNNNVVLFFAELLTGQLFITDVFYQDYKSLETEISRFMPDEIVVPDIKILKTVIPFLKQIGFNITLEKFDLHENDAIDQANHWFKDQFNNIENKNIENLESFKLGLGLIYQYLKRNNQRALTELKTLFIYKPEDFLILDAATLKNLEIVKNNKDGTASNTLFSVLDKAVTPMGSRTLKKWLLRPLIKQEAINQRLDCIETLFNNIDFEKILINNIKQIGDLERIVGRIALKRAHLNDYINLIKMLEVVPLIKETLSNGPQNKLLNIIESKIVDFSELYKLLVNSINIDTAQQWIIKSGYNTELDRLRYLIEQGTQEIIKLERKEQKVTNINSLKIRYNGINGYSIEVTKSNANSVPDYYIKVQTLTNKERFTTQELKDLEYDINRANNEIAEIEKQLFEDIKSEVEKYLNNLKKLSHSLSYLDALTALTQVAYTNNYTRPEFNNNKEIIIKDGRHPVIESFLSSKFISNSTSLTSNESLWILTGPNMGGKSTYLRQVALICLMAQIGSFVPAKHANVFILDRIFTRIGASDNLSEGKSTFLIEMEEVATICNKATENSLVILDEVGRGTSTFDGIAIAQSVIEHIYQLKAKCLFATHYHELTMLNKKLENLALYHAASTKTEDKILLLHKITPGIACGSFGLEVAKLAQLPEKLVKRATEILENLNSKNNIII